MKLDVMPTDEYILGFSNRWYAAALAHAQELAIDDLRLRIVTAPYFVATKLEAFRGRGPVELNELETQRFLGMMSFANVESIEGYRALLSENGCQVSVAEDTGRFPSYMDLYVNMIEMQLTYDVIATLAFRKDLLETVVDGFRFLGRMGRERKVIQARVIARKK